MGKAKNITIRDVAKMAQVSPATVSLVLNNSDRSFSNEVRSRVLKAVKNLKYHPSGVGRPSVGNSRKKLESLRQKVVILVDAPHISLSDSIYNQVQKGAEMELASRKIDLLVQNTSSFMLPIETTGIIVVGEYTEEKRRLIGQKPFVVCMGRPAAHTPAYDYVTYNNRDVPIMAARYLINQKHEKIGTINLSNSVIFRERYDVFKKTVQSCGKTFFPLPPMDHADLFNEPRGMDVLLKKYLLGDDRPTALFMPADTITSVAYPLLYSIGVIPGKDIEVVSCNNEYLRLAGLTPCPTEIDIKAFEIGRFAAVQLVTRMKHPNSPWVNLQLRPELIEGNKWQDYIKKYKYNN